MALIAGAPTGFFAKKPIKKWKIAKNAKKRIK
jgi:hypothetical protein